MQNKQNKNYHLTPISVNIENFVLKKECLLVINLLVFLRKEMQKKTCKVTPTGFEPKTT